MATSLWQRWRQPRWRWPLRLAILLVGGLLLLAWTLWGQARALPVLNRAGQPITRLRVTVAGQISTFHDLHAGVEVSAPFGNEAGDRFAVEGRLADGALIHVQGVVPRGTSLVIRPRGEVSFSKGDPAPPR